MTSSAVPGWQDRLMGRVHATQKSHLGRGRTQILVLTGDPQVRTLLHAAARGRGINQQSYVRRAIALQVAKDLGMAWTDVLRFFPGAQPWGRKYTPQEVATQPMDTGEGYGQW